MVGEPDLTLEASAAARAQDSASTGVSLSGGAPPWLRWSAVLGGLAVPSEGTKVPVVGEAGLGSPAEPAALGVVTRRIQLPKRLSRLVPPAAGLVVCHNSNTIRWDSGLDGGPLASSNTASHAMIQEGWWEDGRGAQGSQDRPSPDCLPAGMVAHRPLQQWTRSLRQPWPWRRRPALCASKRFQTSGGGPFALLQSTRRHQ